MHLIFLDCVIDPRPAIIITESSKAEESDTVACKALLPGWKNEMHTAITMHCIYFECNFVLTNLSGGTFHEGAMTSRIANSCSTHQGAV